MTIDEFSTQEQLEQWGVQNFWILMETIPESEPFSELMTAFLGMRALKRTSRKWNPEELRFHEYLEMEMRSEFAKAAREGRFETAAEIALNVFEVGA